MQHIIAELSHLEGRALLHPCDDLVRHAGRAELGRSGEKGELLEHGLVVGRVAEHAHATEVPGRRREEGQTGDVDELSCLVECQDVPAGRGRERPETDDDEVDRGERLGAELGHVARHVTARQDASVDRGMECRQLRDGRLIGPTGQLLESADLDADRSERGARARRGHDLDVELEELSGEVEDRGAIGDREQGTHPVLFLPRRRARLGAARGPPSIATAPWRPDGARGLTVPEA